MCTSVRLDGDHRGVWLDVALMHIVRREGVLKYLCSRGETLLDIPQLPGDVGMNVGKVGKIFGGSMRIGAILRMKNRRVGLHRLLRVEDRRELLVFDLDVRQGLVGQIGVLCRHHRHLLADEPHVVFGKDRHIVHPTPDEQVRELFGGQHGQHPGRRSAALVSMRTMRACGRGLRRALPQIMLGSRISAL